MNDASKDAGRYFASEGLPAGAEGGTGTFYELAEMTPLLFVPGLEFRPVLGERMLVNFATYEPGTVVPRHAHEEEQITFVLEGEFEFEVGGETRTMRAGTALHIPSNVPHAARTYDTRCLQVDVFCPPRRVLVEAMEASAG